MAWSLAATLGFVVVEIAAGLKAHSLALLADAGHNFTDALALLLAAVGVYVQSKPPDEVKTYGYHRAGVLAAFVNALTLVAVSLWILYESAVRLLSPEAVEEGVMMAVAAAGLVVNAAIMWALRRASRDDLSVRSAFIHMLGDALGSAAIVLGAFAIRYTGWVRLDPVLSLIIGLLIVWTAWDIVRETLNILLEGLPRGLHLSDVKEAIGGVAGVIDVHDLHIWSLGAKTHALSCHVVIADLPPSESDAILKRLNEMLESRFQIGHATVQFEHVCCPMSAHVCALPALAEDGEEHGHHSP